LILLLDLLVAGSIVHWDVGIVVRICGSKGV